MQLDHIVILLPYRDIVDPPEWITSHFTISPGGRHGDGKTENKLIIFRDGTYLELIAFVDDDPDHRKGHWWDKPFGVVDYALTAPDPIDLDALNAKLPGGVSYVAPKEGGRKKPDGSELRWRVTFPKDVERGLLPFFCFDLTPRERRVPLGKENTEHPCGAVGVGEVTVRMNAEQVKRFQPALDVLTSDGKVDAPEGSNRPEVEIVEGSRGLSILVHTTKGSVEDIDKEVDGGIVEIHFGKK